MSAAELIYWILFSLITLFFISFAISSIWENKSRAVLMSVLSMVVNSGLFLVLPLFFNNKIYLFTAADAVVILGMVLFFARIGKNKEINIGRITEKVDERDTMFARNDYKPGTKTYEKYYNDKPGLKKIDDSIRGKPGLLAPGSRFYDPVKSRYVASLFEIEGQHVNFVDGKVSDKKFEDSPENFTKIIKEQTLHLGADEVGVAKLNPMYVYSHVGRGPEPWGEKIELEHQFVICYTVEMDYFKVEEAPKTGTTEETALKYLHCQRISNSIAEFIRNMGYSARAHISGSNYQLMLPPAAYDAGLGEIGRLGYLISRKYGPRVRLGAVTTNLPLKTDKPVNFGVQDFCEKCNKCAVNCPSGSIPKGNKENVRGVEKWRINIESCFKYWQIIGTDCNMCMKVCPFSHPNTLPHKILRKAIENSSIARTVSNWGDDIFYGTKFKINGNNHD